jgi:hypothetical protein
MRDRAFLLSRRSAFLDNGHGRWCMCDVGHWLPVGGFDSCIGSMDAGLFDFYMVFNVCC